MDRVLRRGGRLMPAAPSGPDVVALLLHPVRLRIVQVLAGDRRLTARQIAQAEPDIPHATLYRHLQQLVAGGLLAVADERPVRNMTEKAYALAAPVRLDPAETVHLAPADLLRLFTAFVALLLGDFRRYLQRGGEAPADFRRDGVTFWQYSVSLSVEDAWRVDQAIKAALRPFLTRPAERAEGRHLVTFTMMPAVEPPSATEVTE
jgi:DNA-binding transcriptional ArsR family regulator